MIFKGWVQVGHGTMGSRSSEFLEEEQDNLLEGEGDGTGMG